MNDPRSIGRRESEKWQPEELRKCLEIVEVKTETSEGRALAIPWDHDKENRFHNAMSTAGALARQHREPDKPCTD
jgi:hypothetical protein